MNKSTITAFVAAIITLAYTGNARAGTIYSLASGDTRVYIGKTVRPGQSVYRIFACFDPIQGNNNETWVQLGTTTYLTEGWDIHLDQSGGSDNGNDVAYVVVNGGLTVTGDCAPNSTYTTSFAAISFSGWWIDVFGDGGNDEFNQVGLPAGYDDVIFYGGDGDDNLEMYGCIGGSAMWGGSGNDNLVGLTGSCERFWAGSGQDCLVDQNDSHGWYDCGADSDTWDDDDSPSVGCEAGGGVSPPPSCGWPW